MDELRRVREPEAAIVDAVKDSIDKIVGRREPFGVIELTRGVIERHKVGESAPDVDRNKQQRPPPIFRNRVSRAARPVDKGAEQLSK